MKQTKKSIIEACHGKIMEKADYALEQVLANINDMNTDERKKRAITIKLEFAPQNERKEIKGIGKTCAGKPNRNNVIQCHGAE